LSVIAEICRILDNNAFAQPAEIRRMIASASKQRLSASAVRFWMKRAGYTRKKPSHQVYRPGLPDEQALFCAQSMAIFDSDRVVSCDETSIYLDMNPSHGYARRPRWRLVSPSGGRARWTLLMAVTNERVVGWQLIKGSTTSTTFSQFIAGLNTDGRDIIMMDNAAFHKTQDVLRVFDQRNLTTLFLPPYTPQLQPIEHCFATLKSAYRRLGRPSGLPTMSTIDARVRDILPCITQAALTRTFDTCWDRAAHWASDWHVNRSV
jgi:hypothetical protein